MYVQVDNVWSSPSVLHFRVTVLDDAGRWRHRYYPVVNLDTIPEEAVRPLLDHFASTGADEQQMLLFES